jgi:hypothetical protein
MEPTPAEISRGKIERSAEALRVATTRFLFPSENRILLQRRVRDQADKEQEVAHITCHWEEGVSPTKAISD